MHKKIRPKSKETLPEIPPPQLCSICYGYAAYAPAATDRMETNVIISTLLIEYRVQTVAIKQSIREL